MREIYNQVERIRIASEKQEPLPIYTTSFRETIQLPCAHDIDHLITQKKSIPLEDCHYHWRFVRCSIWDSRRNMSPNGPNANPSLQHGSATQNNSREPTPNPQTPPDREDVDSDFESQSHKSPVQRHKRPMPLLPLDPRLQTIEDPITIKPPGRPSGSLNKKRSRKDIAFERSTRRNPSLFEHRESEFSVSQQRGIPRSGIRGKAVRRAQNEHQTRTDLAQSGNLSGIPADMTSVFSI